MLKEKNDPPSWWFSLYNKPCAFLVAQDLNIETKKRIQALSNYKAFI